MVYMVFVFLYIEVFSFRYFYLLVEGFFAWMRFRVIGLEMVGFGCDGGKMWFFRDVVWI